MLLEKARLELHKNAMRSFQQILEVPSPPTKKAFLYNFAWVEVVCLISKILLLKKLKTCL